MKKRYSIFIQPISVIVNLIIINFILRVNLNEGYSGLWHILFINLSWLVIAYHLNFYSIRRYNKPGDVLTKLFMQFLIFTFVYFAYYSITYKTIDPLKHIQILSYIFISITAFRTIYFYALRKYRIEGGNFRNIIFIGSNKSMQNLFNFVQEHPELGYHVLGYFSANNGTYSTHLGKIEDSFDYTLEHTVDEIFCSISELSKEQIQKFISFSDNNLKVLKLIPDAKDIYTTKMIVEYYDYIPILSLRKIPIDDPVNQLLKRFFDVLTSLIVIVFLLSWLTPLLFIIIKIDSKGPLFFKQIRDGLNGDTFTCYKYRSMYLNDLSEEKQATIKDNRVTKIGRFLRKTSIDELPQFFNVFIGDMSIVGPRPHMLSQTKKYAKIVDKFMVRHFVKPGITGLAQVNGYRGEVEKNEDMENRVKLDIFYIENWSFLLDIKIIGQTILNIFKGEIKAY